VNLRTIALKPGELRPLDRGGLLLLGLRCAARVAPWRPPSAEAPWAAGWALAMAAAVGPPADPAAARALARALADAGARACNALTGADEPLGRAHNYACSTLSTVVEAAAVADRPPLLKEVILAAKLSASIPALLAHAGRAPLPAGADPSGDPVAAAMERVWSAIRADVGALAAGAQGVRAAADPGAALAALGPTWPGGAPAWIPPAG
jgi:hypothetical protein